MYIWIIPALIYMLGVVLSLADKDIGEALVFAIVFVGCAILSRDNK
jgi:cell division protein FtsW (lipid II flippase)